ncbi:MAG: hypothetical protein KDD70_11815 [Bdellovibrionales bacterium]|nr:hypothetical protein [Bdellovibrionales bacterium]
MNPHTSPEIHWNPSVRNEHLRVSEVLEHAAGQWQIGSATQWTDTESGGIRVELTPFDTPSSETVKGFARHIALLLETQVEVYPSKVCDEPSSFPPVQIEAPAFRSELPANFDHPLRGKRFLDLQLLRDTTGEIERAFDLKRGPEVGAAAFEAVRGQIANALEKTAIESVIFSHNGRGITTSISILREHFQKEDLQKFFDELSAIQKTHENIPITLQINHDDSKFDLLLKHALHDIHGPRQIDINHSERIVSVITSFVPLSDDERIRKFFKESGYRLRFYQVSSISELDEQKRDSLVAIVPPSLNSESPDLSAPESVQRISSLLRAAPIKPAVSFRDDHLYVQFALPSLPERFVERLSKQISEISGIPVATSIFTTPLEQCKSDLPIAELSELVQYLAELHPKRERVATSAGKISIHYHSTSDAEAADREGEFQDVIEALKSLAPGVSVDVVRNTGDRFRFDVVARACREVGFSGEWVLSQKQDDEPVGLWLKDSSSHREDVLPKIKELTGKVAFTLLEREPEHGACLVLSSPPRDNGKFLVDFSEAEDIAKELTRKVPECLRVKNCRVEGNSFILESPLAKPPKALLHRLEEQFAEEGVYVRLRYGSETVSWEKREPAKQIIALSIPEGFLLRGIKEEPGGFVVRLNSPENSERDLRDWKRELSAIMNANLDIRFDRRLTRSILEVMGSALNASGDIVRYPTIARLKDHEFPEAPVFSRGPATGYIDESQSGLEVLAVDPRFARIRESGLSAFRLDDGHHIEIGHHVVDRTICAPSGGKVEAFALDHPFGLYGERSIRLPFDPHSAAEHGSLNRGTVIPVISTYVVIDPETGEYDSPEVELELVRVHATPPYRRVNEWLQKDKSKIQETTIGLLLQAKEALTSKRIEEGAYVGIETDPARALVEGLSLFFDEQTTRWVQNLNENVPIIYRSSDMPDLHKRQQIIEEIRRVAGDPVLGGDVSDPVSFFRFIQLAHNFIPRPAVIERIVSNHTGRGKFSADEIREGGVMNSHARFNAPWRKIDAFLNQANLVAVLQKTPPPFSREALDHHAQRLTFDTARDELKYQTNTLNHYDTALAHGRVKDSVVTAYVIQPSGAEQISGAGSAIAGMIYIPELDSMGRLNYTSSKKLRPLDRVEVKLKGYRPSQRLGEFELA